MDKIARTLKIALVQLQVTANKANNISHAVAKIRSAKTLGAVKEILLLVKSLNDYLINSIRILLLYQNALIRLMVQSSSQNMLKRYLLEKQV